MKIIFQKITAVFLLMLLILPLTACADRKAKPAADQAEAGYTYQAEEKEIDLGIDPYISAENMTIDDRVYIDFSDDTGSEYLISCKPDGSDIVKTELPEFKNSQSGLILVLDDQKQLRLLSVSSGRIQKYYLHTLDKKGNITDTITLETEFSGISLENDNQLVVYHDTVYFSQGSVIYTFDKNGKPGKTFHNHDGIIRSMFRAGSDIYLYEVSEKEDGYQAGFRKLDLKTGKIGKLIAIEEDYNPPYVSFSQNGDSEVYFDNSIGICSYDFSTGTLTEIFQWINIGVDSDHINGWFPLKDGGFLALHFPFGDDGTESQKFISIDKVPAAKEKTVLTLACLGDSNVKDQILSFNRTHTDICIEVTNYDLYENAEERMKLDFTTGQIPDIVDATFFPNFRQLAKNGMFLDLYSLIDKDKEISREDFISSILKTLEIDGKLYCMGPKFYINGLGSGKEIIGGREGLTADEMIAAYEKLPEDSAFLPHCTKQNFIPQFLHERIEEYLDLSTGKADFHDDSFLALMEFSKRLPDQEEDEYLNKIISNQEQMMQSKHLLFGQANIGSLSDFQHNKKLWERAGGFCMVSYPSKDGNNRLSMSLSVGGMLAITEQCRDKEAAWEFLRTFFTYEYQESDDEPFFDLPTRQDVLDKKLEYAIANPTKEEIDDYTLDPWSEEDAASFQSLIDRIGISENYNDEYEAVFDIVEEELGAYFAGDKSARQTVDLIENRVNLYLSENS